MFDDERDDEPKLYLRGGDAVLVRSGEFDVDIRAPELPILRKLVERWRPRYSLWPEVKAKPLWIPKRELEVYKATGSEKAWENLRRKLGDLIESKPGPDGGVRLRERVRVVTLAKRRLPA